jgi:hypothetical protein
MTGDGVSLLSLPDPDERKNLTLFVENSVELHWVRRIYLAYVAVS